LWCQKPTHGGGLALAACAVRTLVVRMLAQPRRCERENWARGCLGRGTHGGAESVRTGCAGGSARGRFKQSSSMVSRGSRR
jgi:hypothetical protein